MNKPLCSQCGQHEKTSCSRFPARLGCVLLCLGAANLFPDQTWHTLTIAEALYDSTVSRRTSVPSGADRQIRDTRDQPCYAHISDELEQIFANPQAFVHRIVTIRGLYYSGFEISSLHACGNGHFVDLWMEDASSVVSMAKLNEHLPSRERFREPILSFKFDEHRNAAAWGKLPSQWCSQLKHTRTKVQLRLTVTEL